jgi:type I restriction enzyme M protein
MSTKTLWVYDLRTNMHFTLKQNPLRSEHLEDFIRAYNPKSRYERTESERFKPFSYEQLLQRDKVSLDLIWLRDETLEDSENLPPPDVLAQEIAEDLEAALSEFAQIAESLRSTKEERSA